MVETSAGHVRGASWSTEIRGRKTSVMRVRGSRSVDVRSVFSTAPISDSFPVATQAWMCECALLSFGCGGRLIQTEVGRGWAYVTKKSSLAMEVLRS
jgi:hypothetical protein